MNNSFDAIVIGSGIGGLSAAALLARRGKHRVVVLEQHFTAGGLTHCFKRKSRYQFDVGLHYVGELGAGGAWRDVFDYLTDGELKWSPMPHRFDRFVYPDFEFAVPADEREYRTSLIDRFPHEARAITRYFKDIQRAARWYVAAQVAEMLPQPVRWMCTASFRTCGGLARLTTGEYLDARVRDDRLKALLTSHWGDYGLPPAHSSFGIHALITRHFLAGAAFPVGGSRRIAATMIPAIEAAGGAVRTRTRVDEILIRDGRAVGVRVSDPYKPASPAHEFYAPLIISDAGAKNTYCKLLSSDVPISFRDELSAVADGMSAVTVYVGFKRSPATLGVAGENYWLFSDYDHDRYRTHSAWDEFCYLSFPSLKDPEAGAHTAEIISFTLYDDFRRWAGTAWKHRGPAYEALKATIAESMLARVEARLPGFRDLVDYVDVSTPLSVENFESSPGGALYGIPATPERFGRPWTRARTPIPNLFLTGADTMSPGILGALIGGVKTAAIVEGAAGFPAIMRAARRAARARSADAADGLHMPSQT